MYITLSLPLLQPLIENCYVKHIVCFKHHYASYILEFVYFVGIKPLIITPCHWNHQSCSNQQNKVFLNHPLNQADWRSWKKLYYHHQSHGNLMPPKAMVTPCIILLESSNSHEPYHWNLWNLEHHQGCQLPHTRGLWFKRPNQSDIPTSRDICLAMAEGENLMEPIKGKWLELHYIKLNHHVSNKLPRK